MKQYRLVDNIVGWLTFLIAAFVYCSTIEPTASFWDCPEFIATGYKLEIGHPPGAPFFMLTANLFSHFASDPSQVARWVNTMSALLSATTILFLFWSITHLTRKLIMKDWSELSLGKLIAIEGSGLVGALIYTFSDTFWFSILFWWSSATLRHIVIQKASIDSICAHCSRRFQTFIIVSCTTSSASSLLRVIRRAMRKSSFFSGNTSVRKLISFILSKY